MCDSLSARRQGCQGNNGAFFWRSFFREHVHAHGIGTERTRRDDVRLEELQITAGQIRLAGKSDMTKGAFPRPSLPSRRVLQSKFPNRRIQDVSRQRAELARRITTPPAS